MKLTSARSITKLHVHHTWKPDFSNFNGKNHQQVFDNIKNYHVKFNGWSDIGYHFLIFPDGVIMAGRNIDSTPSSAKGFNTGSIAVSCVGNFDKGADIITNNQLIALVYMLVVLMKNHKLTSDDIRYHHHMNPDKSCPGTNFLKTGNSVEAYQSSLKKLVDQNSKLI